MKFDQENKIVKLCAKGMSFEGEGKTNEAAGCFQQAWEMATGDFEKCIAAHYFARHQHSVTDKLKWDIKALGYASKINDLEIREIYPSLYLNIAKGYEDLQELSKAKVNYEAALDYVEYLNDDGYGQMFKRGILGGIDRITSTTEL